MFPGFLAGKFAVTVAFVLNHSIDNRQFVCYYMLLLLPFITHSLAGMHPSVCITNTQELVRSIWQLGMIHASKTTWITIGIVS
jgi:hypothetical protein